MPWSPLARLGAGRKAHRLLGEGRKRYAQLELADAEPLLRDALKAARESGSPTLVADAAKDYYYLLRRTKRYVDALPVLEAWLAATIRASGRDSDRARLVRNELTWLDGKLERFDAAEEVTRERLASARRRHGDRHNETGFALVTLGWALLNQGRVEEADAVYHEALGLLEKVAGQEHGATGWALLGLAAIAVARSDVGAAEAELQRAFDNWDRVGRLDMALRTREQLLDLFLANGQGEKAAALADDDLRRVNRQGWGSDSRRARNLDRNATALRAVGRVDEAKRLETRAQYLRAAIEDDRAAVAAARQRDQARRDEPPGTLFEGEEDWPLATPVFIFD
jgi:tetratricopeptide (TPR) repeat protein